ncbi:SycD/LcrH family type III secretion system chaperone [Chromobacterium sp. ASV23]|uniref:SycD/LcrH family type III secretion system chaperone n=1 Tax=Chromobacterium sp. ASV23 TaxID=2795110 RepID=UPI0018ECBA62|nr:SycD/LcrH family type III secretion system chaperone [Chromobacterium sp. ASV23]
MTSLNIPLTATPAEQAEAAARRCLEVLEGRATLGNITGYSAAELEAIYERGYRAWSAGDLDSATADFAFLALQQPLDRRFLFAFACALKRHGEFRHALTFFGYSVAMQANDPFATFHIAECLLAMDELNAARDALDTTIALCYGQADADPRFTPLRQRAENMLDDLNH